jgi:hypothetical protein
MAALLQVRVANECILVTEPMRRHVKTAGPLQQLLRPSRGVVKGQGVPLGMSRICPEYLGRESSDHSVGADVLVREEPDEDEDEEDQEENDSDEEHSDEGYSE